MKKFIRILMTPLALLLSMGVASAQGVVVSQSNVDAEQIVRIYMGYDRAIRAINLNPDDATRERFESQVLGRPSAQVRAHWSRLVFTGRASALREVATDEEVLEFVRSNPNTIGYISDEAKAGDLNILARF